VRIQCITKKPNPTNLYLQKCIRVVVESFDLFNVALPSTTQ